MSLEGGIGAVIGGIAGFFLGGPAGAWQGAQIGYVAGSALGAEGQSVQGPRLSDLRIQSSSYGKDIPIVYGSARMSGNIIWGLPLRETATEEDQGKGGGGSTVTTYTYDATFAVLLCEGPIVGIRKIWAYGELIYNLSDDASLETIIASNRAARSFTIYTGSETQEPDPLIQADLGADNTQAYRGYAYVVFNRLQLEKYGKRIPELTFEVVGAGSVTGPRVIQKNNYAYSLPSLVNRFVGPVQKINEGIIDFHFANLQSYEDQQGLDYYENSQRYRFTFDGRFISVVDYKISPSAPPEDQENVLDVFYDNDAGFLVQGQSGLIARFCGMIGGQKLWVFGGLNASDELGVTEKLTLALGDIENADVPLDFSASISLDGILINEGESGVIHSVVTSETSDFAICLCGTAGGSGAIQRWYRIESDGNGAFVSDSGTVSPSITVGSLASRSIARSYTDINNSVFATTDGKRFWSAHVSATQIIVELYTIDNNNNITVQSVDNFSEGSVTSGFVKDDMFYLLTNSSISVYTDLPSVTSAGVLLSEIQTDICERAGLAISDIDVTDLTDTVTGYVIPRNMSGRAASEQLMKAFFYDPADIGNKITFVKRGGASVATITADDIGAHYYGSDFETISHERLQDPELPSEIVVKHIDQNRAYQDGAQRSQRITHPVENISTTELSIVMTATKAKQIAEIWMQNAFTERDKYSFSLSRDFIDLNPTDVITVPTGGGNRDLRITKITYAPVMDIEAVADSPYTSNAAAGEGDAIGGNVGLQGPTNLLLLDIPLLRNADNDEGIYLAASGYYDAWTGAQVFTSNSEADGYTSKTSIFNDAVIGSATTALADANSYDWDRSNTVTIQLVNGDLSSITEDQVTQGNNYCILGDEIIQYANATLNANGTYTLDTLTRGRRGTDWSTNSHAVGDRFVFIGALTLKRIDQAFNALKYYKAATFGSFLDEADAQSLTNTGVSLKPFSGYKLSFALDGSNNLTGSWQTRSRYIAPTFRDLPLFEGSEEYEIDIVKAGVVLETKTVTTNALSYTAAQQTSDGLTPGDFDTIRVYQMSEIVGRGYVAEYTL